jgi:hypothetical protein
VIHWWIQKCSVGCGFVHCLTPTLKLKVMDRNCRAPPTHAKSANLTNEEKMFQSASR